MELTTSLHRYLTTAPSSHFVGQEVQMLDHWQGHDNLLWRVEGRGQEAVVKLFLDAGQARGRRQYDAHERFAPFGIAPQPLWFDRYPEGLSRQVLAYLWVPGEPLDLADARQAAALAQSVALVHSGDPADVRRFCPHPVNLDYFWRVLRGGIPALQQWLAGQQTDELRLLFDQLAASAQALVEKSLPLWQNTLPTPVHGDLRVENVIDSFGVAVLLDWEMFGLGDPALDVATFLHLSRDRLATAAADEWLDLYLAGFDQPGLHQRIAVYRTILPFQDVCFLLNGLREHLRQPAAGDEITGALPFLSATLAAAFVQAATMFNMDVSEDRIAHAIVVLLSA
jgi:hypothetical protein